jgi:hypothetical protein
MVLGEPSKT